MRGNDEIMAGSILLVVFGMLAVFLVIGILFLLTLSKALSRCHPRNRTMEPGMVWLMLIPLFNIVWQFFVVNRVGESLRREYRARGLRPQGDFAINLGVTSCALGLLGWIPILGALLGIASLICRIIYWVKIAGFSAELAQDGDPVAPSSRDDGYEDDYDDRPRRSRRDDRDEEDDYDDRPRKPRRDSRDDRDEEDDRPRKPRRDDRD